MTTENTIHSVDLEYRRYPDEDKVEAVLDELYRFAWESNALDSRDLVRISEGLRWVLSVWNKALGTQRLAEIVEVQYLAPLSNGMDAEKTVRTLKDLDLIICFFHHYIYAFEEFLDRKFRHAVIRCGLICERIIKRLSLASGHAEILELPNFDQKTNRLRSVLESKYGDILFLADFVRYIYAQRSNKGAHDTGAASVMIAKTCMSQTPTIYLFYLEALGKIGYPIPLKQELLNLVNSTISTGTTLILSQEGKSRSCAEVLESQYKQGFFSVPRSQADIIQRLGDFGFSFPRMTLSDTLRRLSGRGGFIIKRVGLYAQRLPPTEFYETEVFS